MHAVFVPAAGYVSESRGWYQAVKAANDTIITDPYIDAFMEAEADNLYLASASL